jgi:cystathionine beta-lyase/cystathionine gamma-synthase
MPLYQSSVYTIPDLDALDRIMKAEEPGFIYARDGHPNARRLAEQLAELEGGAWAVVCGSGMAAISALALALVQKGERIVASDRLYGRTTLLLDKELARYGVETTFVDCCDQRAVGAALEKGAKLLIVETISNPLLRLVDIEALARMAHDRGCQLVVDNTFATPVLVRPLDLGADFVMESLTKMIGGHSDVTLGMLCGRGQELPRISQVVTTWGLASNPFDCWLAQRGLATLNLRMKAASNNAAQLAVWLVEQPGIDKVVYPALRNHPDHRLSERLLAAGSGSMLCFELVGGREAVNRFMRRATDVPFSPSLGDVQTTCSHPASTSHRYVDPEERRRLGIGDSLIRLSVGVEAIDVIKQRLAKGLG